ncbi:hypothetical protein ACHAXR_012211 [Thalassiosira sp. AJA248-18]
MFQPTAVKSSSAAMDDNNDDATNDNPRKQQHSQSSSSSSSSHYILENSPHPILDGIDGLRNAMNGGSRGGGGGDGDGNEKVPSNKRPYYPSESEFISAGRGGIKHDDDEENNDGITAKKESSIGKRKHNNGEDNNSNNNNNLSDDDSDDYNEDQKGETTIEIPTLETYIPRPPSYTKANAIPFGEICRRLETLWNLRFSQKKVPKLDRLAYLLPDSMQAYLQGGSPYPYLRLILSEHDSSRPHTGMKEARIADTWVHALGLAKGNEYEKRLRNFRDSRVIANPNSVGDLSIVIMDVVKERMPVVGKGGGGSKLTVGEVNEWLDVLIDIVKDRFGMATSSSTTVEEEGGGGAVEKSKWRKELEKAVASHRNGKKFEKYSILVERLIKKKISPVEHKFIVRILLQHIHVGINLRDTMNYISPHASEIFNSFNSLKDVCTRLSDPEYVRLLKATVEKSTKEIMENNRQIWMTPSTFPAVIQKTISPMLSRRTMFHTFLKEVAHRHSQLDKALPAESPAKSCMAIRHPAFTCEIKMDGERDLVHIKRGIVTIQTRNGTWYSPLYSPAIGPSIRAAIAKYDVDVILDGEMIAWDASENQPVPFGSNRAVAEMNRRRRVRDGTLDQRDVGLHKNEADINVMTMAKAKDLSRSFENSKALDGVADDQFWLQYVVFDILYVDGPDAKDLISKSSHLFSKDEPIRTGSLINMDLMQRKSILYNLIQPQEKVVEHIRSVVVRSDGTSMDAADYFLGKCGLEYGRTPCELDSIYLALCEKSGTTKFDSKRAQGQTHEEIEIERSLSLEQFYNQIVDLGGQEGLIFKDLASPYYLGSKSRSMGYWWKLKPDYDESGSASDIDLVVLGGRYACGFDKRGMVSSLIVGCLTSEYQHGGLGCKYMAVTKVTFNKTPEKILQDYTGFQRADEHGELQLGKWFQSDDVPDFFSSMSYQRDENGDDGGWKPDKKDRPDIWIKPEDSFVVTINAGEFQTSSSFQAGFSLRFPRISRYRGKGSEDPKNPDQVASWGELNTIFDEQEANRQEEVSFGSQTQRQTSRFLTAKQLQMTAKQKPKKSRKQTTEVKQFHIPDAGTPLSKVLDGFIFSVQPGIYCLENDAFALAEAEENGWATEAKSVKSRDDVMQFIHSHGGKCQLTVHQGTDFLLGGSVTDAKVSNLIKLMAETDVISTTKKDAEARRLIEMGGILKWSFVYAIVSKFLRQLDDDASGYEKSIKTDWPSLAHPRHSDFLAMSDAAETALEATEDKYGLRIHEISSSLDFSRALENMARRKSSKKVDKSPTSVIPWQSRAMNSFADNERWIFGGKPQKLWPYGEHADTNGSMCILYPDLFADFGFEEEEDADKEARAVSESPRWKDVMESKSLRKVAAALPLAKALGAVVTPYLHSGVTHILCDLKRHKMLKWSSMHPLTVFSDAESGSKIHERLISLEESAALNGASHENVLLVSPDWLEEKWNKD